MVDFNVDILNCDSDQDTTDFIYTVCASSLYPPINTPTMRELQKPEKL